MLFRSFVQHGLFCSLAHKKLPSRPFFVLEIAKECKCFRHNIFSFYQKHVEYQIKAIEMVTAAQISGCTRSKSMAINNEKTLKRLLQL